MLFTSSAYKTAIVGNERRMKPLIICEFSSDVSGYPFATATATSEQTGKEATKAVNGRIRATTDTATNYPPKELWSAHSGWWSNDVSDVDGNIATQTLVITYNNAFAWQNYFLIGSASNYPVDFTLERSTDGITWTTITVVSGNTSAMWGYRESVPQSLQYVRFIITKISAANSPCKVLQAGALTTICLDYQDVVSLRPLEELSADSDTPIGLISANYVEFSLNNSNRLWDYNNTSSPFQKITRNKFKVRPFLGVEISSGHYEYVPLGVFYVDSAQTKTNKITAAFLGYDRLYEIKDKTPPVFPAAQNITLYKLFQYLFEGIGLSLSNGDFQISKYFRQVIPWGFFAGAVGSDFSEETVGNVGVILKTLCEAGNAYAACDRFGKIIVRSNFKSETPECTITDTNQIFSTTNENNFANYYDAVRCRYRIPQGLGSETLLYELTDYYIPNGGGNTLEFDFENPVGQVTRIQLEGATNSSIATAKTGAVRNQITFANAGTGETVTFRIYGKELKFFNTSYDENEFGVTDPKNIFKISNWLIQDIVTAREYAQAFLHYVNDPARDFELKIRGDPSIEVGDIIQQTDNTNDIDETVQVMRQEITWNGFLNCQMKTRKAIANTQWAWSAYPIESEGCYRKTGYWCYPSGCQPAYEVEI